MSSSRRFSSGYSKILPRLYLGNLMTVSRRHTIMRLAITHLVSVMISPISSKELAKCVKYNLYISAMDHECQDLISYFDVVYKFIHDALTDSSNKVFVHCVAGVSRSATLIIAYIMKSKGISYRAAFAIVANSRRAVNPNGGFIDQLRLYQRMNCNLDITNRDYRLIALESLVHEYRISSITHYKPLVWIAIRSGSHEELVPTIDYISIRNQENKDSTDSPSEESNASDKTIHTDKSDNSDRNDCINCSLKFYFSKLQLKNKNLYPRIYKKSSNYKCNKCRTTIFHSISILKPPISIELYGSAASNESSSSHSKLQNRKCHYFYIEPQPWMKKHLLERNGIIKCLNCNTKLGKFDWSCESRCNCLKHEPIRQLSILKIHKKKVLIPSSHAGVVP